MAGSHYTAVAAWVVTLVAMAVSSGVEVGAAAPVRGAVPVDTLLATALVEGVEEARVQPGQTVSLPVVLDMTGVSGVGDLGSFQFDLFYPARILRYDSMTIGVSGAASENGEEPGRFRFAFAGTEVQGSPVITLVTMHFTVHADAPAGESSYFDLRFTDAPHSTTFARYPMPRVVNGGVRVVGGSG